MADKVPAGAFPEAAKLEQEIATATLGGKRAAFDSRAKSLSEMRKVVNETDSELAELRARVEQLEETIRQRPF